MPKTKSKRREGRIETHMLLLVAAVTAIVIEACTIVLKARQTGAWDITAIILVILGSLFVLGLGILVRLGKSETNAFASEVNKQLNEGAKSVSVGLRVRRVIHEDAYVAVLITDDLLKPNRDGTASLNFEKFVAQAIRISQSEGVDWQIEESSIEPHPIQGPVPEGRRSLDSYYSTPADSDEIT